MKTAAEHWVEPLQILEKIGQTEGLHIFVQDGLDCGFSRQEIAELYGTFFEDRLAETLLLATAGGDYPANVEFVRRVSEVLLTPQRLFARGEPGRKALPVDSDFFSCFREALFAIEGAFNRYVEGDYVREVPVSGLLCEAREYLDPHKLNLGRAHDRITVAGALVLEGEYLAKPTEWMEIDPLYSWLLGLERLAQKRKGVDGWPDGPYAVWRGDRRIVLDKGSEHASAATLTRPRREVLALLLKEEFSTAELRRIRRNRRWIGPELLRLLRMPGERVTGTLVRNVVRALGAVTFRPAVDDLLGLLMRVGVFQEGEEYEEEEEALAAACEEALRSFGGTIKEQVLHHLELAVVDGQRTALARVLSAVPNDDTVMDALESLTQRVHTDRARWRLLEMIAAYRHRRSRPILLTELEYADAEHRHALSRHLRTLVGNRRSRKAVS